MCCNGTAVWSTALRCNGEAWSRFASHGEETRCNGKAQHRIAKQRRGKACLGRAMRRNGMAM